MLTRSDTRRLRLVDLGDVMLDDGIAPSAAMLRDRGYVAAFARACFRARRSRQLVRLWNLADHADDAIADELLAIVNAAIAKHCTPRRRAAR